jgi:hypothetical protein
MIDRPVHDLMSKARDAAPKLFSFYLSNPNVVLLGDPGAGKSHLFRHFAQVEQGHYLSARAFLNLDAASLISTKVLFIDALDEKRAGRGDHNTIDQMVTKLCLIRPERIRIACRAADWLGDTDLAAFQAYFEQAGAHVVLALAPLSSDEAVSVLEELGINEPREFLRQARERGLDELLANPQNLIMLASVVLNDEWPANRTDLFRQTVDVLLSEHNTGHARQAAGSFTSKELIATAGNLCAVRLISDIDGISIAEFNVAEQLPSYRNLTIGDRDKAQATLGRRVFVSGHERETVDYTHRTVAEYLAAGWLSQQVREGLPLGRVTALLGVEGRPASELRGLHAWLPIVLPEHAREIISADPFGVLSYGDAASLSASHRQCLLEGLARLAQVDPWFRAGNWTSTAVASLSAPDMAESFRRVLEDKGAGFTLRSVVLDALSVGEPIPELQQELTRIFVDRDCPYAERQASFEALRRLGHAGDAVVAANYSHLSAAPDELRLRATVLTQLYGIHFGPAHVAILLNDALASRGDVIGGGFWNFDSRIPTNDIPHILEQLLTTPPNVSHGDNWRPTFEVLHAVDRLLTRVVTDCPEVSGESLWVWLGVRCAIQEHGGGGDSNDLNAALASRPRTLARVADAAIRGLVVDEHRWGYVHHIWRATVNALTDSLLLERVLQNLEREAPRKRAFLYELAITLAFRIGPETAATFDYLYDYATADEELVLVREACCFSHIDDWRTEQAQRRRSTALERERGRAKNRTEFALHRDQIRDGAHREWLGWIGAVYFSLFQDVDNQSSPRQRLAAELGDENASVAIAGLIAFVRRGETTEISDVARMAVEGRAHWWWYALIAGLDELPFSGNALYELPDAYLRSALAIDCVRPTHRHHGNTVREFEHAWKRDILLSRPHLACDAYLALARACFANASQHVYGLHELMHLDQLRAFRHESAMSLLREFRPTQRFELCDLLGVALRAHSDELVGLARERAIQCKAQENISCYSLWVAAGFIAGPAEFRAELDNIDTEQRKALLWALRDLSGGSRNSGNESIRLAVEQLEVIARLAATEFPNTDHPSGGWSGNTNPWDASELLRNVVNLLAANPSPQAGQALARLEAEPRISTYLDYVKHARAQQHVRAVDAQFQQPDWHRVVTVLANGAPSNVADLHALLLAHLDDLKSSVRSSNTDIYKRFWNEDGYGRIRNPKSEESCRDVLVDMLRDRLRRQGISVEPEGHMLGNRRADIVAGAVGMKIVVELKRDYHQEVWRAIHEQLDRFYTRDFEASGFGIYGVFWFGKKRPARLAGAPIGVPEPETAQEMQEQLQSLVPDGKKNKIQVRVIDVSGN